MSKRNYQNWWIRVSAWKEGHGSHWGPSFHEGGKRQNRWADSCSECVVKGKEGDIYGFKSVGWQTLRHSQISHPLGGVRDREPLDLGWSEWTICHIEAETNFNANIYGSGDNYPVLYLKKHSGDCSNHHLGGSNNRSAAGCDEWAHSLDSAGLSCIHRQSDSVHLASHSLCGVKAVCSSHCQREYNQLWFYLCKGKHGWSFITRKHSEDSRIAQGRENLVRKRLWCPF